MISARRIVGAVAALAGCLIVLGISVASPAAASSFGLPSLRAGQPHFLGNDSPFRLNVISGSGKRLLTSVTDSVASGGVRYGGFSVTVGA